MKSSSLSLSTAAIALLTAALFAVTVAAQAPQGPPPGGGPLTGGGPPRTFPKPKNLKVLPKNFTGQQVHDTMEGWAGALGVHCDACHAADPTNIGPNGKPRLKFEDDSKDDKKMARIMYKMTEDVKTRYIAKVAAMDKMGSPAPPLTCGACHRGHLDPEAYVPPKEEGPHPPGGAMPMPMQK